VRCPAPVAAFALLALVLGSAARADDPAPEPAPSSRLVLGDTDAGRSVRDLLRTPLSVSTVSNEEFQRGRPALGLEDALYLVPGAFVESVRNFAQDARVSIRGFGANAPFGVRGVKVLVDGVPSSLPDGQSEIDSIDLGFAERIDVVRGPISSLYGGGGGGIVSITTAAPTAEPHLRLRSVFGSDHLFRQEALATGSAGDTGYVAGLGYTRWSGYRDHARGQQATFLGKLVRELEAGTLLEASFTNVWAPEAQDPGGLTEAEVNCCRSDAAATARTFDAGERLDQQQLALRATHPLGEASQVALTGYWVARDFRNALPFQDTGRTRFQRDVVGGSVVASGQRGRVRWLGGVDVDVQDDLRDRNDNDGGAWGALRVRQSEIVRAVGGFAENDVELGGGFGLVGGVRYDWTEFVVGDRLVTTDDRSDRIRMRELSPRLGAYFGRSDALRLYANWSTSFRVPTTVEFSPRDLLGGFDSTLDPERAAGFEVGAKGLVADRVFYDVALFQIMVRDALIPYEDPSGRALFRNAGEVRRRGAEAGLSLLVLDWLTLRASYTALDAEYRDYDRVDAPGVVTELDGNREPNLPVHSFGAELRADHPSGWFGALGARGWSKLESNDDNRGKSGRAFVCDARVGRAFALGALRLAPFAGARNWSGDRYEGVIRPNANAGRYYEPAPESEVYAGLEISY
jgi:iron complex outermembrane receptor protein